VGLSSRTVTAMRPPTEVRTGRTERLEVSRELPQATTASAPRGRARAATASMYSSATPVRRPATYSATAAAANPAARGVNAFSKSALLPAADGDGDVFHDVGQHVGGGAADHLGLGGGDQPVGQHRGDQLLDVVGAPVGAPRPRPGGPGRPQQGQGGPGAGPQGQVGVVP